MAAAPTWMNVWINRTFHTKCYTSITTTLPTLLKKFTSKVDGFTFVHFCLKVITSDVKVLYDLLMLYVRRYYLLREVAWHWNLLANQPSVNIRYLLPINSVCSEFTAYSYKKCKSGPLYSFAQHSSTIMNRRAGFAKNRLSTWVKNDPLKWEPSVQCSLALK